MEIEIAQEGHVPELVTLIRAMHAESGRFELPFSEARAKATFEAALADYKGVYCVLLARTSGGEAAGFLFGTITRPWFSDALIAHDHAFFVSPRWRGSSAALKLLRVFRRWAGKRSATVLNISQRAGVEMERFDRFMERQGFRAIGKNFSTGLVETGTDAV